MSRRIDGAGAVVIAAGEWTDSVDGLDGEFERYMGPARGVPVVGSRALLEYVAVIPSLLGKRASVFAVPWVRPSTSVVTRRRCGFVVVSPQSQSMAYVSHSWSDRSRVSS